jgi:hypothetical protein
MRRRAKNLPKGVSGEFGISIVKVGLFNVLITLGNLERVYLPRRFLPRNVKIGEVFYLGICRQRVQSVESLPEYRWSTELAIRVI